MTLLKLVTDLAAARRLTRLVVEDEITAPIRAHGFFKRHDKLSYLINCPYCVAVYTSAFVSLSSIVFPRASKTLLYALALAEFQASLKDFESQRQALVQDYGPPL